MQADPDAIDRPRRALDAERCRCLQVLQLWAREDDGVWRLLAFPATPVAPR